MRPAASAKHAIIEHPLEQRAPWAVPSPRSTPISASSPAPIAPQTALVDADAGASMTRCMRAIMQWQIRR